MSMLLMSICRSDFFTDFTSVLRYTVIRFALIFQRVEACRYGFYGVKGHTLIYILNIFSKQAGVLARVRAFLHRKIRKIRKTHIANRYKSTPAGFYGFQNTP